MCIVLLLVSLLASSVQVVAASCYNIISTISRRIPDGFVLAHQEDCYRRSNAAERTRIRANIDKVPGSCIGQTSLRNLISTFGLQQDW